MPSRREASTLQLPPHYLQLKFLPAKRRSVLTPSGLGVSLRILLRPLSSWPHRCRGLSPGKRLSSTAEPSEAPSWASSLTLCRFCPRRVATFAFAGIEFSPCANDSRSETYVM